MEATSTRTGKHAAALGHPLAFQRKHLKSYFESSSGAPLVVIHAPAGYGKTTTLSFVAQEGGASARWVTLDEDDRALASMVYGIVSSIYGWPISRAPSAPDTREAAKWIVGAVEELKVTTLILDDFETVADSEEVNMLIEAVAERLPAYVRIVIASEVTPLLVRKARLRQSVMELDESDLRFDADDVTEYLREIHHYEVPPAVASSIARRSGGCAAVLNLVGQLVHDLPRYLRVDFDALPLGTTEKHLTMLLREVLARAGYSAARASRDLVNVVVGDPNGSLPSDALLDLLASRHCLAQTYATEPRTILPHKLLQQIAHRL